MESQEPSAPQAEEVYQHDEFITPDDSVFSDDGIGSERSSLTSLSSSILKGVTENGRTYAAYGKEEYGMPMDEMELDRIDLAHAKYFILLEKKRFLAPISPNPQKILDLGTGTGIWSIDVADEYPSAEVIGVDVAPSQPQWVPTNCRFEIDDIEADWTWPKETFDFIFARDLLISIRDFPRLLSQCFEHVKPGGWVEFECIMGILKCDDDSLPADSSFKQFDGLIRTAASRFGAPLESAMNFKKWFEEAGFEQCTEVRYKIPSNPWPKDQRMKLVGMYEMENFLSGLEGMSLRLFEKGLGWTKEETSVLLAGVRKEVRNPRLHMYYPFYCVYGRKPLRT